MKITNSSIVKSESALEAITTAINEQYSKSAAAAHIDPLIVNGLVGISVITIDSGTYKTVETNYFIVTDLTCGLMRVEFCSERKEAEKSLVEKVADKFKATPNSDDSISFSFGEDDYCLTDGIIYAVCDGRFLPGFRKVKKLIQVENFIALRSE